MFHVWVDQDLQEIVLEHRLIIESNKIILTLGISPVQAKKRMLKVIDAERAPQAACVCARCPKD